ncbi:hypothetical protein UlMin_026700 [Ulmus minor]
MDPELYKVSIHGKHEDFDIEAGSNRIGQVTRGQGNTILHAATKSGNKAFVEGILTCNPSLLHEINTKGDTALHIAAKLGYLEVATLLITHAKSIPVAELGRPCLLRMANREKNTALHEAVRNNHYDIVDLLIKEEPSLTLCTNDAGDSPLFTAADKKFYRIARRILETFPYCSCSGRNGMTVMHAATLRLFTFKKLRRTEPLWVQCISVIIAKLLIGFRNRCGIVSSNKEEAFVKHVLKVCGPKILERQDDRGWTPLHYAAHIGNEEVIKLFLETNHYLAYKLTKTDAMSALHISVRNGCRNGVLMEKCPDLCEFLDNRGRTVLHVAVEMGDKDWVAALLNEKAFGDLINDKDIEGNTALHLAAIYGRYRILTRLAKDRRIDKETTNKAGMTVMDIIKSSTHLSGAKQVFLMKMLKRKGLQLSLENRITIEEFPIAVETKDREDNKKPVEEDFTFERVRSLVNINLVVATIIASITFAAAMAMLGGFNVDGMEVLREKTSFKHFLAFDSLAFGCSTASMCIHFLVVFASSLNFREEYTYPITCVMFLTLASIGSTLVAFVFGTNAVSKHCSGSALPGIIAITSFFVPVSFFFVRIVFLFRICGSMFTILD